MRHRKTIKRFSRPAFQRKALVKSLIRAVITKERISTTEAKAKAIRSWVEKLITLAKKDTLHNRRLSYRLLEDHTLVNRLFESIGPRFKEVPGGYTRVIDFGNRKGDGAKLSILELTRKEEKEKKPVAKKEKAVKEKKETEKVVPKKTEKPKKGLMSGVKKMFKKERDSL
jgi:large subunit ribosomal protein L17